MVHPNALTLGCVCHHDRVVCTELQEAAGAVPEPVKKATRKRKSDLKQDDESEPKSKKAKGKWRRYCYHPAPLATTVPFLVGFLVLNTTFRR